MRKQPWMKRGESELTDLLSMPKVWRVQKEGLNKGNEVAQRNATDGHFV